MRVGENRISPLARIHPGAVVGEDCSIGDFTIVNDGVVLGDAVQIDSHCIIGREAPRAKDPRLEIGRNSVIRSHSVIYAGSRFGPGLTTGHHVTIRENTIAGPGFQVGTLGDVQGDLTIGQFVKTHSNVHLGQGSVVGDYVWIFPYVVLTNDPHPPSEVRRGVTIERFAVVATMSTIMPGVRVGEGALVGAQSFVNRDVAPGMVVGGVPAREICETTKILHKETRQPAYPWRRHFHRGYPEDVVKHWQQEFAAR